MRFVPIRPPRDVLQVAKAGNRRPWSGTTLSLSWDAFALFGRCLCLVLLSSELGQEGPEAERVRVVAVAFDVCESDCVAKL